MGLTGKSSRTNYMVHRKNAAALATSTTTLGHPYEAWVASGIAQQPVNAGSTNYNAGVTSSSWD